MSSRGRQFVCYFIAVNYISKERSKNSNKTYCPLPSADGCFSSLLGVAQHLSPISLLLPIHLQRYPLLHFFLSSLQCNLHQKCLCYHFCINSQYDDLHFIFCMLPSYAEIKGELMIEALSALSEIPLLIFALRCCLLIEFLMETANSAFSYKFTFLKAAHLQPRCYFLLPFHDPFLD